MQDRSVGMIRFAQRLIGKSHQHPDDAGRHDDRLAFTKVKLLLHDHQNVGRYEKDQRENSGYSAGQILDLTASGCQGRQSRDKQA